MNRSQYFLYLGLQLEMLPAIGNPERMFLGKFCKFKKNYIKPIYGHHTNCGEQSVVLYRDIIYTYIYIHNPIHVELHNSSKKNWLLFEVKSRTVNQLHFFVTRICLFELRMKKLRCNQRYTNPVRQVTVAINCTMAPIKCGSSVRRCLHDTLLGPRIL